jgi:hypothetical protein
VSVEIGLERSGGFAGLIVRGSISGDDLSEDDLHAIDDLVSRFEDSPADVRQSAPDRFQYDLTVREHGVERHVTFFENMIEAELRRLLDRVLERSREQQSKS